jgi:hypothetical protein
MLVQPTFCRGGNGSPRVPCIYRANTMKMDLQSIDELRFRFRCNVTAIRQVNPFREGGTSAFPFHSKVDHGQVHERAETKASIERRS